MTNRLAPVRNFFLLGAGILMGVFMTLNWSALSSFAQGTNNCQSFSQTGYQVCGRFLEYWNANGGLAQQGYPISAQFTETSPLNGKPYTVQYFERAVFEYHPENQAPYDVLLSQLGTYLGKAKYTQGFPKDNAAVPFFENRNDPVSALESFYNAINRKEYDRAYGYFQGAPNPPASLVGPKAEWIKGYANTATVTLAVGKVTSDAGAGNLYASFPVVITSTQTDNSKQVFSGCYTMHRVNDGISDTPNDVLWSINSATISAAASGATMDQLLAQQCPRQ